MPRFDYQNSTDCELLVRFEQVRDQSAFAELVRRHGPMVMATSIRTLGHGPDAEDAFQATFFALAKGVRQIRNKDAVAGWLHQTAKRSSSSIRRGQIKRQIESMGPDVADTAADTSSNNPMFAALNHEVRQILDEEIARLPSKLRAIVVLCHLEGLSLSDAAKRLGLTPSSVHVRLAKSRAKLKARLLYRGVTVTLGSVTVAMVDSTKSAAAMVAEKTALVTEQSTAFAAGTIAPSTVNLAVLTAAKKEVDLLLFGGISRILSLATLFLLFAGLSGSLGFGTVQSLMAAPTRITIIAPPNLGSMDGDDMSAPNRANLVARTQELWSASYFDELPPGGAWLIGFADRLDGPASSGRPSPITLTQNITLSVSTSTRDNVSRAYEENVGDDVVQVLRGTVTRQYVASAGGGANPFGAPYEFDTPFFYDPSKGDLLLDFRLHGGNGDDVVYDAQRVGSPVVNFGSASATEATGVVDDHVVCQFIFSIDKPSPPQAASQ